MKLIFSLEYRTNFGEELMLTILPNGTDGKPEEYRMQTRDGRQWTCELTRAMHSGTCMEYCYSVYRGNEMLRHEWAIQPHRLEFTSTKITRYILYDRWTDVPEDACLYSSAFTDCANVHKIQPATINDSTGLACLKVRTPQLKAGQRLALTGADDALGNWNPAEAIAMTEQAYNEWICRIDVSKLKSSCLEFKFIILEGKKPMPIWETGKNHRIDLSPVQDNEAVIYELPQIYFSTTPWKGAGTVIPVFSLRSEGSFGVGDFGDLKLMTDWVARTGQRVLQVLPVNDTNITHTWQDSYPYNSISIYALHPQYIDLRQLPPLRDETLREKYEQLRCELNRLPQIDYERVNHAKTEYLHILFGQEGEKTKRTKTYKDFLVRNREWMEPYARFCYYRDLYGTAAFAEWPVPLPQADTRVLEFWYFVQYHLDKQMRAAHAYARKQHIILKGDIPIGISRDGVEAWIEPRYFNMNGQAGAPPDPFSKNGQNWGFPTYNWEEMLSDGCSWWVRRFRKMAEYFDAYRIDHVLGFFRIWEIPVHSVHGLLGQFSPALGLTPQEIGAYGLHWKEELYTKPYITDWVLDRLFGEHVKHVKETYLDHRQDDRWQMKPEFDTQRKVEKWFAEHPELSGYVRDGLYSLISNVLFVRDRRENNKFHPRIAVQTDFAYEALRESDKHAFNRLYNDYFYNRNNHYWYQEAMKKLPLLTQATRMLVCAEDLGMVPECVPWVMNELRILSLEIQSMPKEMGVRFGNPAKNPYHSVCTISTHDMPTLRQWWDENKERAQDYFITQLRHEGMAPHPLSGELAKEIIGEHLASPSMLCLLSLQDWLAMDETLRQPDANAERINVPANPRHYWRWRMHLTIEELMQASDFNDTVCTLISQSKRK